MGAVEADSPGLFQEATLYIGETENRYLTGEVRRKVIYHLYKLPQVTINNKKVLLRDGELFCIGDIKIECMRVPGHTWGHIWLQFPVLPLLYCRERPLCHTAGASKYP